MEKGTDRALAVGCRTCTAAKRRFGMASSAQAALQTLPAQVQCRAAEDSIRFCKKLSTPFGTSSGGDRPANACFQDVTRPGSAGRGLNHQGWHEAHTRGPSGAPNQQARSRSPRTNLRCCRGHRARRPPGPAASPTPHPFAAAGGAAADQISQQFLQQHTHLPHMRHQQAAFQFPGPTVGAQPRAG